MKEYLLIQSKGEIEENALRLIGASTKRGDTSKIGYFGSGLKYAISSLLRNKIDFHIYSGYKEIKISTKPTMFRGNQFNTIMINNVETGMTDQMGGKDWDNSFAPIREIYSNALDEDPLSILTKTNELKTREGYTLFYVETNPFTIDVYENFNKYFCFKREDVVYSNRFASCYPSFNQELVLYRKGIQSLNDSNTKALYSYNSTLFDINEARVLSDTWSAKYYISKSWVRCDNVSAINSLLLALNGGNSGFYEHGIVWSCNEQFSLAWLEAIKDKKFAAVEYIEMFKEEDISNRYKISISLLRQLKAQFQEKIDVLGLETKKSQIYFQVKPSKDLADKTLDAISLLKKTRYSLRLDNPKIEFVQFTDSGIRGMADNNKILLSEKLELQPIETISKVIIEENEHIKSKHGDLTRSFQNHLFDLYFSELTQSELVPQGNLEENDLFPEFKF